MNCFSDTQAIVFYTVPPDVLCDGLDTPVSGGHPAGVDSARAGVSASVSARQGRARPAKSEPGTIDGQVVATWAGLTEMAVDSSPETIIWAFSSNGWAKTWTAGKGASRHTASAVQGDGSLREVDSEGDIAMADCSTARQHPAVRAEQASQTFEASCWRAMGGWAADRMSGTASVDVVEEAGGIARIDVELR